MPCHMVGKPMFYAAKFGKFRHVVGQGGTAGHIEKFVAFPFTLVFFHDTPWNIKEKYITLAFCFLPFEPYPKISLAVRVQIGNIQIAHISICDASEARKKHLSKGDRNEENQTQPVVNKRFCSCLPLRPNSRERQDNARFPLPSHYLFHYLPEA